ncbi:5-azacytidine-induced protein 2 [Paramormyrops kingsleyae]|uniref:5-azacytidine-induced protein 2 n=1 Tax=Paramormyrops kingsleyae TaxID=1676925 RepID=A0A3B3QF53_9TELE|nr:5-azacytidine-induced protein 2 [Paramormyrops kingsleyae]
MDPATMEDDICILKHETACPPIESPVSGCPGDESLASHFALVTAYEDIKTRLRDAEQENALLRRRVRQLEDKLYKPEEAATDGQRYVNKAYSAYRGIYIQKKDLQMELNKLKQEKSESERLLTDQLQARELELLQLRTEMETSQVMRSLSASHMGTVNSELQIQTLQQELERLRLQCQNLQEKCQELPEMPSRGAKQNQEVESPTGGGTLLQTYADLRGAMSRLRVETRAQSEALRRLKDSSRRASSSIPVQCLDDVERNKQMPRPPSAPPVPSSAGRPCPPTGPPPVGGANEYTWKGVFSSTPPVPGPPPQSSDSLDISSWSFPTPPKPSDALFWENPSTPPADMAHGSPGTEWLRPY